VLVDNVEFRLLPSAHNDAIEILVNGRSLADVIGAVEMPFADAEGHPSIAGRYANLRLRQLDALPTDHFRGSANSHLDCGPNDKTVLLICECGEPGCWPLMARIDVTANTVVWTDFEQPHRQGSWNYDGVRLKFDLHQYQLALMEFDRENGGGDYHPNTRR
jgi:hypothetical protein